MSTYQVAEQNEPDTTTHVNIADAKEIQLLLQTHIKEIEVLLERLAATGLIETLKLTRRKNGSMLGAEVVAEVLDISVSHVHNLAKRDQLPFPTYKFGRTVRFRRVDVEAFVAG